MAGDGAAWSFALGGGFALSPAGSPGKAASKGKRYGNGKGGAYDNLAGYTLTDPQGIQHSRFQALLAKELGSRANTISYLTPLEQMKHHKVILRRAAHNLASHPGGVATGPVRRPSQHLHACNPAA